MQMSTRGRYGLRAMVELAENPDQPLLLKEIAANQDISMKYLGRIISALKSAGLISRVSDGYLLTRAPGEISCRQVINTLEGSLAPADCVDNPEICDRLSECVVVDLFSRLKSTWEEELEATSLADLVDRKNSKDR